jgi:P-type conjugative transfer protein TrbJ
MMNNSELMMQVRQLNESLNNEITQIANQITQITNQITMIQDMVFNTLNAPMQLIGTITGAVQRVMGLYNQAQGLLNRLSNIDQEFYNKFYSRLGAAMAGSTGWTENYSEKYFELSEAIEQAAKDTVESLKVSADDINDSGRLLEELARNAGSAAGRNAILQAGNDLLGFIGGEMTKARALMLEQTKSYLDFAMRRQTIEDAAAAVAQKEIENWEDLPETRVVVPNVQF